MYDDFEMDGVVLFNFPKRLRNPPSHVASLFELNKLGALQDPSSHVASLF